MAKILVPAKRPGYPWLIAGYRVLALSMSA
jgi:hypothetical protein